MSADLTPPHMPLLLRADASMSVGTGHVMRCLALAQAWQDTGGRAVMVLGDGGSPALATRLMAEGVRVEALDARHGSADDGHRTIWLAHSLGSEWVVVDGYQFSGSYQRQLHEACLRVLALDDYGHAEHYYADLVLNQNLHASPALYRRRAPFTRLLLGPRFTLLRREFRVAASRQRRTPAVARRVLVSLGGADSGNATRKVVEAVRLQPTGSLEVVLLVGALNPWRSDLEELAQQTPGVKVLVNAVDMPGLMTWADVAVVAGGSTCWELAFMGLPALVLVLAENQRASAAALHRCGIALNLGTPEALPADAIARVLTHLCTSPAQRAAMTRRGQQLIDGQGAVRVCAFLAKEWEENHERLARR
jgi:UDP-2,4-diacetamido-2,4,6-trideoxy-beta-L-altropyranose hydrolase